MSEDLSDRVDELLAETAATLEDVPDDEPAEAIEHDGLGDLADEAATVLETTGAEELLAAVGLTDEAAGPGSIPAAIATGDPEKVTDLRALLKLAALAPSDEDEADDRDADSVANVLAELRETVEDRYPIDGGEATATHEDAGGDGAESDAAEAESESGGESGEEPTGGEAIESAMRSALTEARDEIGGFRERLGGDENSDDESAADDGFLDRGDEDGLLDRDEANGGGILDRDEGGLLGGGETEAAADEDEEEEDLTDRGEDLADRDQGMGEQDVGAGGGRSRLRTMPGQDRADMRALRRHSTMPDR